MNARNYDGFTLIELLVVIAIIAILAAILFPVFILVKAQGQLTSCTSNMRQLGTAFQGYASDWSGRLPTLCGNQTGASEVFWKTQVNKYCGYRGDIDPVAGQASAFGQTYMRCPSAPRWYVCTYGVNYPTIIDYNPGYPWNGLGSVRLDRVPRKVYVAADFSGRGVSHRSAAIPCPIHRSNSWPFNTDYDGDGIDDSNTNQIAAADRGWWPYNGWNPIHRGGGPILFADGHVKYVMIKQFVTNADGMWGDANPRVYR